MSEPMYDYDDDDGEECDYGSGGGCGYCESHGEDQGGESPGGFRHESSSKEKRAFGAKVNRMIALLKCHGFAGDLWDEAKSWVREFDDGELSSDPTHEAARWLDAGFTVIGSRYVTSAIQDLRGRCQPENAQAVLQSCGLTLTDDEEIRGQDGLAALDDYCRANAV